MAPRRRKPRCVVLSAGNSRPSVAASADADTALVVIAVAFKGGEEPAVSARCVATAEQADMLVRALHAQVAEVFPDTDLETRCYRIRRKSEQALHA